MVLVEKTVAEQIAAAKSVVLHQQAALQVASPQTLQVALQADSHRTLQAAPQVVVALLMPAAQTNIQQLVKSEMMAIVLEGV